ncbi:hypothetical protein EG329_005660 [Mollisiaceae sp. DMI_Dod_QoI]|nr:hypothetical protein EG329_005660 [Helotiales sp. DMI_Dod_QoI]
MGGWDTNCALCGAGFGPFYQPFGPEDGVDSEDEEAGYDGEVLGREDLEWLDKVRVIGFNPEAFGVRKCFITGRGNAQDYGQINCLIGDDPNVPPGSRNEPEKVSLAVYSNYDPNEPLAIPFHEDCFVLLSKVIHYHLHGTVPPNLSEGEKFTGEDDLALGFVSKEALYVAMKKKYVMDSYDHCLTNVDYAELSDLVREQYWDCVRGTEAWVSNPLTSPQLEAFFTQAQNLGLASSRTTRSSSANATSFTVGTKNPFTEFPKELISEILLYLPLASLKSFALSGLIPFRLSQNNAFWHRKTILDFAFLYDFPTLEGERYWLSIYQELHRQCYATTYVLRGHGAEESDFEERDKSLVLGLANRRRVWGICVQIVEGYVEEMKELEDEKEAQDGVEKGIVDGSLNLLMPIVGNPVPSDGKAVNGYFVESWEGLKRGARLVFWFQDWEENEDGRLCGVGMPGGRAFGMKGKKTVEVEIEKGCWIEGLVLNIYGGSENALKDVKIGITGVELILDNGRNIQVGSQNGDKRLLKANDGMVVIGLIGELSNGIITRLGILQAPSPNSKSFLPPSKRVPEIQRPLWHTSLPPPNVQASPYETGYWMPARSYDTIPMSFILFSLDGTFDQLSKLRGIESDPESRCWGVKYNIGAEDGNEGGTESGKRTGPQDCMSQVKMFRVDGEGGERVVKVEIGMNSLAMGVKITTNKDRFAFFGPTQKNYHIAYEETEKAFIVGLYISWGYGNERRLCSTVSILSAAKPGHKVEEGVIEGVTHRIVFSPPRPEGHPSSWIAPGPHGHIALVDEGEYGKYESGHW